MTTIILLALAGTVISIIIGTFWYSEATPMGRLHMRVVGFDKLPHEEQERLKNEMKPKMWKYYLAQMVLSFLTSFAVVFIVTMSLQNGVPLSMAIGFVAVNWLCFMVPVNGSQVLWGNVDREIAWQKFFYDIASNLVTVILIALLASFFA